MLARLNFMLFSFVVAPGILLYSAGKGQTHKAKRGSNTVATAQIAPGSFTKEALPFVQKYCVACHGANAPAAGISLANDKSTADMLKDRDRWNKVLHAVTSSIMPPPGSPRPEEPERLKFVAYAENVFAQVDCKLKDPGRVTLRRLNREEYNNTIHDLFGIDFRPADDFPSDDVGYGFDNIGDVLSTSPLLMEKYLNAAEKVTRLAIVTPEDINKPVLYNGSQISSIQANPFPTGGKILATNGEMWIDHDFVKAGEYTFHIEAFGQQAGKEPALMGVKLDDKYLDKIFVKAVERKMETYTLKAQVKAGKHRLSVTFENDFYDPTEKNPNRRDRNLIVQKIEVKGEEMGLPDVLPEAHKRIFCVPMTSDRQETARKILTIFARRAFRRPATTQEVERLTKYVTMASANGESFEKGIALAIQAALCSPHFLFRTEISPIKPGEKAGGLSGYELASRLSYFLWSSMPDEKLLQLAANGELRKPEVLAEQAKRMLKDPKSKALTDNFAGQWLNLRKLSIVNPDTKLFPGFDNELRQAMRRETELFFQEVITQDRNILDFLDGKFTYLNEKLAKHYGRTDITGSEFHRVVLTGGERQGILTQASILTITSNPTRTSPVKRGKWVLENILGTPPPPALANVPPLSDDKNNGKPLTGTLRQRMEEHRKNPICASCHTQMDAIGFGMENFNAVGGWRDTDGGDKIDPSGSLPGGQKFQGPVDLIQVLKSKKSLFVRNFTEKLMTYALGRGLEPTDKCELDTLMGTLPAKDYRFSAVVTAIVQSNPFRKRRADGDAK